jgi:transcriptional regulator with XRE-family HTH domain
MVKKFQNLRGKMSPERQAKVQVKTKELLDAMPMQQLRRARELSQEQLAEALRVKQGSVSKLERRTDLYISTLRRYIEAMGGDLELRANFPEGSVTITSLGEIDNSQKDDRDDEPMQATA